MTDKPVIPAWLKEGAIVRCNAPIGVMRVTHVDDSGVTARRARSTSHDAFQQLHSCFFQASVRERVHFLIDAAKIDVRDVIADVADARRFQVILKAATTTDTFETLKPLFEKVHSAKGVRIAVTVPQAWLDEIASPDTETALIREKVKSGIPFSQLPPEREADPAVVAWLTKTLTDAGQDMTGTKIIPSHRLGHPMGVDPTYAIIFAKTGQITVTQLDLKRAGLFEPVLNGTKITVDLPDGWTPEYEAKSSNEETDAWVKSVNDAARAADEAFADVMGMSPVVHLAVEDPGVQKATDRFVKIASSGEFKNTDELFDADEPAVQDDPELTETARRIKKLEAENARLRAVYEGAVVYANQRLARISEIEAERDAANVLAEQRQEIIDGLIADIEGRDLRAEDALEAADEPVTIAAHMATICKEWEIVEAATPAELNKRERERWMPVHFQFEDGKLKVVYCRYEGAPAAPSATQTRVTRQADMVMFPPADTHGALHARPEKVHTFAENRLNVDPSEPPRNYGLIARERRDEEIATDRATLTAMSADMEVGHGEFTLAVRQSRLPRQEQDELVARSYKSRTMFQTQQDLAGWQPVQYRSFESLMAGAK